MKTFNQLLDEALREAKTDKSHNAAIKFEHKKYSTDRIAKSVFRILENTQLCSMATVREDNSHINTAYFCNNNHLDLFFVSQASSTHIKNINKNTSMAITIFDTRQPWNNQKTGIQLFGNARTVNKQEFKHGSELYKTRFPDSIINKQSFYVFTPDRIKILDENDFGEETYIEAKIIRDIKKT